MSGWIVAAILYGLGLAYLYVKPVEEDSRWWMLVTAVTWPFTAALCAWLELWDWLKERR